MRFEQLEYLMAVVDTGSFSAAAQKLFVTQQAVSISMRQLEEEQGKPLFVKERNNMILTGYGEKMLEFAQRTLEEKHMLVDYFQTDVSKRDTLHIFQSEKNMCLCRLRM